METMSDKIGQFLKERKELQSQLKTQTSNSRVLLIDGTNLFIRSFSANPHLDYNGNHIGGTTGSLKTIHNLLTNLNPTRCIITFDGRGGSNRRKEMLSGYKSGRSFTQRLTRVEGLEEEDGNQLTYNVIEEMKIFAEFLSMLPISIMIYDNVEADDVISYLADGYLANIDENEEVIIASGDKDFFQLINDKIKIWYFPKRKLMTRETFAKEFHDMLTENYIYYKCLLGDQSDSIPGIQGIGKKTMSKFFFFKDRIIEDIDHLIECINEVIDNEDNMKKEYGFTTRDINVLKKIISSKEQLQLNYNLMSLRDIPISGSILSNIRKHFNKEIPELQFAKFKSTFIKRGYFNEFKSIDMWINEGFGRLNKFRGKK